MWDSSFIRYADSVRFSIRLLLWLVVCLLLGVLLGSGWSFRPSYLPFSRKEPVAFQLYSTNPDYHIALNPLRSTHNIAQKFERELSQHSIARIEILITGTLQPAHSYAWQQPNGEYLFYKSYNLEPEGDTLQLSLSLDKTALDTYKFTSAQVAAELEAMLYSALSSLNPDYSEQEVQMQGDQLYTLLSADSAARLFLVQEVDHAQ